MTIIEALKKLGKSLLGDNYTPTEAKTDSQIAETIEGISKAIDDAGGIGGGSGSGIEIKVKYDIDAAPGDPSIIDPLPAGLSVSDFLDATIMTYMGDNPIGFTKPFMVSMAGEGIQIFVLTPAGQSGVGPMPYTYNPATGEVGISQIGLGDEIGQLV